MLVGLQWLSVDSVCRVEVMVPTGVYCLASPCCDVVVAGVVCVCTVVVGLRKRDGGY
jgi:hypothetical protein